MKRVEAIRYIMHKLAPLDLLILANGRISREALMIDDSNRNFYMLMSMGHASMIGLGLAMNIFDRRVFVLDGDGNIFMNLGALPTIGANHPDNFIHVVLDDRQYGTTGGQRCISDTISVSDLALASRYQNVITVNTLQKLRLSWGYVEECGKPLLLHVIVDPGDEPGTPIVDISPVEIKHRFLSAIEKEDFP
jgi:thiamine pyrophosphate-dependent acetolactate synthase large subunit-like protein